MKKYFEYGDSEIIADLMEVLIPLELRIEKALNTFLPNIRIHVMTSALRTTESHHNTDRTVGVQVAAYHSKAFGISKKMLLHMRIEVTFDYKNRVDGSRIWERDEKDRQKKPLIIPKKGKITYKTIEITLFERLRRSYSKSSSKFLNKYALFVKKTREKLPLELEAKFGVKFSWREE